MNKSEHFGVGESPYGQAAKESWSRLVALFLNPLGMGISNIGTFYLSFIFFVYLLFIYLFFSYA